MSQNFSSFWDILIAFIILKKRKVTPQRCIESFTIFFFCPEVIYNMPEWLDPISIVSLV